MNYNDFGPPQPRQEETVTTGYQQYMGPVFNSKGDIVGKTKASKSKALATPTFFTATSYQQDTPPSSTSSNQAFSFLSNNPVETGVDLNPEPGEETVNIQGSTGEATVPLEDFEKLLEKLEGSKMRQQRQKSVEGRRDIYAQGLASMMGNF
jgi:hypothetical protein